MNIPTRPGESRPFPGLAGHRRRTGLATLAVMLALQAPSQWADAQVAQATPAGITLTNTPDRGPVDAADDRYTAGGDVVYTLVVDNPDGELRGARVLAPLPQDIAAGRWTCRAESGARCGGDEGRGGVDDEPFLPAGSRVTYQWTLAVPADYPRGHASLDAQAALQLPAGVRAADPGRLTARDSDPARPSAGLPAPSTSSAFSAAEAGGLAAGGPGLGARAAVPFPACGPEMYISRGPNAQTNTTLSQLDISSVPFTLTPLGQGGLPYNAIGFNPADNLIYGIEISTRNLVRVYADGTTERLANIANLPAPPATPVGNSYNSGEIGTDGYLYVMTQSTVDRIYRINITNPLSPSAEPIPLVGGTVSGADFAWIDGRLYTVNQNGTVAWIDPGTGVVTTLPTANGDMGNVGALFGTPHALYGSRNDPGGFYEFDLVTGQATRLSGAPAVGTNDGAHCASADITFGIDVGVSKTNTPAQGPNDLPDDFFVPGTDVTYQILVSNRGPTGVADLRVLDPLPAGITTANWTCPITHGVGACRQASGTGGIDTTVDLEFNETTRTTSVATFTFTVTVPLDHPLSHPALVNTVTIELPDGYDDPTTSDHTATDSDPSARANLRVVKTTPSSTTQVGNTIQYSLVVDNLGPADVANAILRDTGNTHLDCLSPPAAPVCTATGSAVCPAAITRAALFGTGVTIPSLPANAGAITVTLACLVTP